MEANLIFLLAQFLIGLMKFVFVNLNLGFQIVGLLVFDLVEFMLKLLVCLDDTWNVAESFVILGLVVKIAILVDDFPKMAYLLALLLDGVSKLLSIH